MSIGADPSPLPCIAIDLAIIGRGRKRMLEGSQEREDWFGTNSNVEFCDFWSGVCVFFFLWKKWSTMANLAHVPMPILA